MCTESIMTHIKWCSQCVLGLRANIMQSCPNMADSVLFCVDLYPLFALCCLSVFLFILSSVSVFKLFPLPLAAGLIFTYKMLLYAFSDKVAYSMSYVRVTVWGKVTSHLEPKIAVWNGVRALASSSGFRLKTCEDHNKVCPCFKYSLSINKGKSLSCPLLPQTNKPSERRNH